MLVVMQAALDPLRPAAEYAGEKPPFNVLIAYEDFESGTNAKRTYDYLVENLQDEFSLSNQMWKFDVLTIPKLRALAVQDALQADLVLVACHGGMLPPDVRIWLSQWTSQKGTAAALVALCDGDVEQTHKLLSEFRAAAHRAGIEFFAEPDFWPGDEPDVPEPPPRAQRALSTLAGVMQRDRAMMR